MEPATLAAELIVRLAEALVDDPRAVTVDVQDLPARTNFRLKVDISDHGKLVGKRGAHIKAFGLVVTLLGQKHGELWTLTAADSDAGEYIARPQAKTPKDYNTHPALALLHEVAGNILNEVAHITVAESLPNTFTFTINPRAVQDYEKLAVEKTVVLKEKGDPLDGDYRPEETMTLVAALGTLWFAYGKREGVTFKVVVPGR